MEVLPRSQVALLWYEKCHDEPLQPTTAYKTPCHPLLGIDYRRNTSTNTTLASGHNRDVEELIFYQLELDRGSSLFMSSGTFWRTGGWCQYCTAI